MHSPVTPGLVRPRSAPFGHALLAIVAGFALCLGAGMIDAKSPESLSGRELLHLCTPDRPNDYDESACHAYFRQTLETFDAQPARPRAMHYCLPPGFGPRQLVELYRLESQLYPQVLHVPAERLITGMVLKFYPCRAI